MSFTENMVVGLISGKVMNSCKVMYKYMVFMENSFKARRFVTFAVLKHRLSTIELVGFVK